MVECPVKSKSVDREEAKENKFRADVVRLTKSLCPKNAKLIRELMYRADVSER